MIACGLLEEGEFGRAETFRVPLEKVDFHNLKWTSCLKSELAKYRHCGPGLELIMIRVMYKTTYLVFKIFENLGTLSLNQVQFFQYIFDLCNLIHHTWATITKIIIE